MRRYIKAVGAGQKRARALSREEAAEAMRLLVDGAEPVQVGAFLLAMRMKGETAEELAGFCDALARSVPSTAAGQLPDVLEVDAHGDGHEGVPSLLPAAACAASALGVPVLLSVESGSPFARHGLSASLASLGLAGSLDGARAARDLSRAGVAACDLSLACPPLARLVALRPLLGVRTLAQTAAKLLSVLHPASQRRAVGVFHAPYLEPTAAALGLLGISRGLVIQALGGLPEARPGKILRVASPGDAPARGVDLRAFTDEDADPGTPAASDVAPDPDRTAIEANQAALDGQRPFARRAAATAGLLIHAATGDDPLLAAEAALAALADGRARAVALRLARSAATQQ